MQVPTHLVVAPSGERIEIYRVSGEEFLHFSWRHFTEVDTEPQQCSSRLFSRRQHAIETACRAYPGCPVFLEELDDVWLQAEDWFLPVLSSIPLPDQEELRVRILSAIKFCYYSSEAFGEDTIDVMVEDVLAEIATFFQTHAQHS